LANFIKTENVIAAYKPQIIFHLAASAHEGCSAFFPRHILRTNYQAFMNVITPAIKYGLEYFITFSSMAIYGNQTPPFDETFLPKPVDVYGVNKAAMEDTLRILANIHDFKYTIIRPHNVIGCRQAIEDSRRNVAGIFMNRIMRGEPIIIYGIDGLQKRSFSGIEYSINCYLKCMELQTNEIINIGGTQPVTVLDLAHEVIDAMGVKKDYPIKFLPDRPLEVKYAWPTYQKSMDLLGYSEPVDGWKQTIHKMAAWAKTLGPQEWMPTRLELINEKTPKTWLPNFDPLKL